MEEFFSEKYGWPSHGAVAEKMSSNTGRSRWRHKIVFQRPPLTSHLDQRLEADNEEEMGELSFIPSAVSEPRWALHMCDYT